MITLGDRPVARLLSAQQMQRVWWRHPELPWIGSAAAAWVYLVADHFVGHGGSAQDPWRFAPLEWMAMVVAMMVPALLPMIRLIGLDSMWSRRVRSPGLFVATTVVVWTAAAGLAALLLGAIGSAAGRSVEPDHRWVAAALFAAAAWQFAPAKVRFLRRSHLRTPLAPRGRKADRSVIRLGLVHGRACLGSCGFAMAAMFLAGHDHVHLMVPLTAIAVVERRTLRPNPHPGGWALAALAFLWLL